MSDPFLPWHRDAWNALDGAHAAGRLAHAMLLVEPRGWGAGFLARQFARRLLGLTAATAMPPRFGQPEHDGDLLAHPDFRLLAPGETDTGKRRAQIRVDEVRATNEFLTRTAAGSHRVLLVELAENLNAAAANALLKRLEEPGPGTHILLVSQAPGRVLATIRSRCQQIQAGTTGAGEAATWLAALPGSDGEEAAALLDLTEGAPLLALSYAEQDAGALAREIREGLEAPEPSVQAAAWARHEPELVLDLLYRTLAGRIRSVAGGGDGRGAAMQGPLRLLERVTAARRAVLAQTNPNPSLLYEDLLAGWKQLQRRGVPG